MYSVFTYQCLVPGINIRYPIVFYLPHFSFFFCEFLRAILSFKHDIELITVARIIDMGNSSGIGLDTEL